MAECPPHLTYVTDSDPGYTRSVAGKKFVYLDEKGKRLSDKKTLNRIDRLVIPPNWSDTWICKDENGHLQSTGRDDRRRKQYLYHSDWMAYRQKHKFQHMVRFGHALPGMRRQINKFLNQEGYGREKVIAIALKLMDLHYLRIGNDFYLSENETYGLTTLRRKHFHQDDVGVQISYKAKSNKYRNIDVTNRKLVKLLQEINELPGYEVFRYKEGGAYYRIDSQDVNSFIRRISGEEFTAKDFRTWGGTVSAVEVYPDAKQLADKNPRKKLDVAIVRKVAKILGNTVATAREYYIHPKVLALLVTEGCEPYQKSLSPDAYKGRYFKKSEALVLNMLGS